MVENKNDNQTNSLIMKALSEDEIDFLKELGNIGSGSAANALAALSNRKIMMNIPRFRKLTTEDLSRESWKNYSLEIPFVTISTKAIDEDNHSLHILIIFDEDTLKALLPIMRSSTTNINITNLSAFDQSILHEIGNILSLRYISALNKFVGTTFIPTVPALFVESSETILTTIATNFKADFANVILIESDIFADDAKLSPLVALIPDEKSVDEMLAKLFAN